MGRPSAGTGGKPTTICRNARADHATQRPFAQSRISHPEQADDPSDAAHCAHPVRSRRVQGRPIPRHSSIPGSRQPPKSYRESETNPFGNPLCQHTLSQRKRADGVVTVLVNSFGQSWSGDGFGGSFGRVRDNAGIVHIDPDTGERRLKHLHDVRGTFCTKLFIADLTDQEVAAIMAWSPSQVAGIRRSYVDQSHVNVAMGQRLRDSL